MTLSSFTDTLKKKKGGEPMSVSYIETGSTDPCFNLAFEEYILKNRREGDWLLLWQNANTVVVGLNQNTAEEVNAAFTREHNITVVRRITGGGAVYHDLGNLNYSFITDLGDAANMSIAQFSRPVCRALASMGVMAEVSGRNDIMVGGKKVSGAAQRIDKDRILHHGTLLFDSDRGMIAGALNADKAKFDSKSAKSVGARVGNIKDCLPEEMTIRQFWDCLQRQLSMDGAVRHRLRAEELAQISAEADAKYRSWDWTYGRNPDYRFKNRVRYPSGTLEVRMNVEHGIIKDISFTGDFMAVADNRAAVAALTGRRLRREDVLAALAGTDIAAAFGGITLEEIVAAIFMDNTERREGG